MAPAKPDCTGERFGFLTVLGQGEIFKDRSGKSRRYWILQCDCGKVIKAQRSNFENPRGTRSCGCARSKGWIKTGRNPSDLTGQRFGSLVALELVLNKKIWDRPVWICRCDCGKTCEMGAKRLKFKYRLNCGDPIHQPELWKHYPPTPNLYPKEAGEILQKYLHLTRSYYEQVDSAIEDEKRDRLIRAAWILTCRKANGEEFSELKERRFIRKHLRYCSTDVFWQRKLESNGGILYTRTGIKKIIGSEMTDSIFQNEAVNPTGETQPNAVDRANQKPRRLKFKRC